MTKNTLYNRTQLYLKHNVTFCSKRKSKRILKKYQATPPEFVIHDTETNGLDPFYGDCVMTRLDGSSYTTWGAKVFCHVLGIHDKEQDHLYITYTHIEDTEGCTLVNWYLQNPSITKVGHKYKFDLQVCHYSDIKIDGPIYDTLTATRMTHDRAPSHSLKYLGNLFAGQENRKGKEGLDRWEVPVKQWLDSARRKQSSSIGKERKAKGLRKLNKEEKQALKEQINYSAVPEDIMIEYAQSDIWYTFLLYIHTQPVIEKTHKHLFSMEMDIIKALMEMERRGCKIDRDKCILAMERLTHRMYLLNLKVQNETKKYGVSSLNVNSPKQLVEFMKAMGFTDEDLKNKEGKVSTDAFVMGRLSRSHPENKFIPLLIMTRACEKLRNTYFKTLYDKSIAKGVAHCTIKPSDTKNGRAACASPNLQNIPNPISPEKHQELAKFMDGVPPVRSVFIPRDGWTNFYFDYSQIEMRVFALFSQNKDMINMINDGEDLHTATAKLVFDEYSRNPKYYRKQSKAVNFGIVFGQGKGALAYNLGLTLQEANDVLDTYFEKLPAVRQFQQSCKRQLYKVGYIEDMFGRRYHVPTEYSYQSVNALVQGASANVLKYAMLQVLRLFDELSLGRDKINLLLTVHDELIIEIHDSVPRWIIPLIKLTMEHIAPIREHGVTIEVDIEYTKTNWADKEDWLISDERIDMELLPGKCRSLEVVKSFREHHLVTAQKYFDNALDKTKILWYNSDRKVDWFIH